MKNRTAVFFALSLAAAVVLFQGRAQAAEKDAEETASAVTITNSGSPNMCGYAIDVTPEGAASWHSGDDVKTGTLPPELAKKLFADVRSARPLDSIGRGLCAKSASFGTATTIAYEGKISPDISCGGDEKTAALYADAHAVQQTLGITLSPRHAAPLQPLARP